MSSFHFCALFPFGARNPDPSGICQQARTGSPMVGASARQPPNVGSSPADRVFTLSSGPYSGSRVFLERLCHHVLLLASQSDVWTMRPAQKIRQDQHRSSEVPNVSSERGIGVADRGATPHPSYRSRARWGVSPYAARYPIPKSSWNAAPKSIITENPASITRLERSRGPSASGRKEASHAR